MLSLTPLGIGVDKRLNPAGGGGAGISFVGGVSARTGATQLTIPLTSLTGGSDAAAQTGDLVVVAYALGATSNQNLALATAGYIELVELYEDRNPDNNLSIFYKFMGDPPDTQVQTTPPATGVNVAAVSVWRGVNTSTPLDVAYVTAQGPTSNVNPPAITPITEGAVILACGAGTAVTQDAVNTPTDLENWVTAHQQGNYDTDVGIGSKEWDGASVFNPSQWTGLSNDPGSAWCAVTLALRPA